MPAADPEIIKLLNAVLKNKLTGINQYFLHARMLKHAGNVKLADYEYKASIDAMKHSDMLVEHILSLGGSPTLQELGRLMIGENAEDMMRNDLTHTETTLAQIRSAIAHCEATQNTATAALLGRISDSQQEHGNFLRSQIVSSQTKPNMKDCA